MPASKTRKSSAVRKSSRKSSSNKTNVSEKQYQNWETSVIEDLKNENSKLLQKCDAKVCGVYNLLPRVFMVLDFDASSENEFVRVKRQHAETFQLHNLKHDDQSNNNEYFVRKPTRVAKRDTKRFVASDLRGLTFYIGQSQNHPWYAMSATDAKKLVLTKTKDSATLTNAQSNEKAVVLLKNMSKMLGKSAPSKTTELVKQVGLWIKSVYDNLTSNDKVSVRLASLDASKTTVKRSRLFIPAQDVRKVMDKTYCIQTGFVNQKRTYKSISNAECKNKYMAINVDENDEVVQNAHLSTNEPQVMVDFMTEKK